MGEHEGGFRDVADAAGTDRDVAQDAPATHQQGEAAFAEGPHRAEQLVAGAVVYAEPTPHPETVPPPEPQRGQCVYQERPGRIRVPGSFAAAAPRCPLFRAVPRRPETN